MGEKLSAPAEAILEGLNEALMDAMEQNVEGIRKTTVQSAPLKEDITSSPS